MAQQGEIVEYHPTIKELPVSERPRERLEHYGAGALSTAELLAIILRIGVGGESVLNLAARLLAKYNGLIGLARASFGELCAEHGIGPAKTTSWPRLSYTSATSTPASCRWANSSAQNAGICTSKRSERERSGLW
jgi:DNA repair protein RadC